MTSPGSARAARRPSRSGHRRRRPRGYLDRLAAASGPDQRARAPVPAGRGQAGARSRTWPSSSPWPAPMSTRSSRAGWPSAASACAQQGQHRPGVARRDVDRGAEVRGRALPAGVEATWPYSASCMASRQVIHTPPTLVGAADVPSPWPSGSMLIGRPSGGQREDRSERNAEARGGTRSDPRGRRAPGPAPGRRDRRRAGRHRPRRRAGPGRPPGDRRVRCLRRVPGAGRRGCCPACRSGARRSCWPPCDLALLTVPDDALPGLVSGLAATEAAAGRAADGAHQRPARPGRAGPRHRARRAPARAAPGHDVHRAPGRPRPADRDLLRGDGPGAAAAGRPGAGDRDGRRAGADRGGGPPALPRRAGQRGQSPGRPGRAVGRCCSARPG